MCFVSYTYKYNKRRNPIAIRGELTINTQQIVFRYHCVDRESKDLDCKTCHIGYERTVYKDNQYHIEQFNVLTTLLYSSFYLSLESFSTTFLRNAID